VRRVAPVGAVLAALLLAGCIPASPDADTYDDKAMRTLGAGVSDVRTVQKLMQTLYDGRMLRPSAIAQMRYSEGSLATASGAFTELNPPPSRDALNEKVSTLMSDASDLLAEARTAIERENVQDYPKLAKEMGKLADKLEKLEERTR
jgi:hypothetical protein